jgi:hypothetical protein
LPARFAVAVALSVFIYVFSLSLFIKGTVKYCQPLLDEAQAKRRKLVMQPFKAFVHTIKYDKQDQQGKAAFNERNPHPTSNKSQWQGAQEDPKQKHTRAQGRAWAG